jgi:hypothetical protein
MVIGSGVMGGGGGIKWDEVKGRSFHYINCKWN